MSDQLAITHPIDAVMPRAFSIQGASIPQHQWDRFQAHLAAHMAASVRAENRAKRNEQLAAIQANNAGVKDRAFLDAKAAARQEAIIAAVGDGGTTREVYHRTPPDFGVDMKSFAAVLRRYRDNGVLSSVYMQCPETYAKTSYWTVVK